nr:TPA_asm: hypothetical protein [Pimephales minnow adintovirus]
MMSSISGKYSQSSMDSDQSSEEDIDDPGNLNAFMEMMFKDHYKEQIVGLMKKMIEDSSYNTFQILCNDDDSKRVSNLKKMMKDVRSLGGNNRWVTLLASCLDNLGEDDPVWDKIKAVLDFMVNSQPKIRFVDTLTMFTYVTDICICMDKKANRYDSDDEEEMAERQELNKDIKRIIEMFSDYILDRDMSLVRKFLFVLDSTCRCS